MPVSRGFNQEKKEIEIENTHIHTHTSVVDRECVRLERKLLNLLFCQESKVIDYVHRFNQCCSLHFFLWDWVSSILFKFVK
jgi:hypothetical protein